MANPRKQIMLGLLKANHNYGYRAITDAAKLWTTFSSLQIFFDIFFKVANYQQNTHLKRKRQPKHTKAASEA
jgi:hypothetical protein